MSFQYRFHVALITFQCRLCHASTKEEKIFFTTWPTISPAPTAEVPPDPLLWFAEQAISSDGFVFVTLSSSTAQSASLSTSQSTLLSAMKGRPSCDLHPGNILRREYRLYAEEGSWLDRFLSLEKAY